MTRLVFAAIWLCLPALVQSQMDVVHWKAIFNDIFGPDQDDLPSMSERQIIQSLDLLTEPNDYTHLIDPRELDTAHYWYSKIKDNDLEDCTPDFLRKISDLHAQQNTGNNNNFRKLYSLCKMNVIEFCSEMFSDLPSMLAYAVDDGKLLQIQEINLVSSLTDRNEDLARELTEPVLKLIDAVSLVPSTEVIAVWNNGPCKMILKTLMEPAIDFGYSDFVDMCLFDKNDTSRHFPQPVRKWASIVDKCKRLDALMPDIIDNLNRERKQDEISWKNKYERIFGIQALFSSAMTEGEIWSEIEYLHSFARDYLSIKTADRQVVNTWYNALSQFHMDNCDAEHLWAMSNSHTMPINWKNPNFEILNAMYREILFQYCKSGFSDLPAKMANEIPDKEFVSFLTQRSAGGPPLTNQKLAERLAETVIRTIESGRRGTAIAEAWDQGTCEQLRKALEEPRWRQCSKFIDMATLMIEKYQEECTDDTEIWIRAIGICNLLDELIPKLARDDSLATDVREQVGYCAGKLQTAPTPRAPSSTFYDTASHNFTSGPSYSLPDLASPPTFSIGNTTKHPRRPKSTYCRFPICPPESQPVWKPDKPGTYQIKKPNGRLTQGYWDGRFWRYLTTGRFIQYMYRYHKSQ